MDNRTITDQQKNVIEAAASAAIPMAHALIGISDDNKHDFAVACFGCFYGALMARFSRDEAQRVVADFAIYSALFEARHRSTKQETLQ
ncbi:MAG: hypothetical protein CVV18_00365 [Gammaproteobacteria bacterium HGW-Gammaproteobacteria-8]|jgi:hypothetical protein|nr:MAG: hypothetical protein CVV18_00365 [Gammaproteobacteria bacterium HGW-Gammaproteobacteria-8]